MLKSEKRRRLLAAGAAAISLAPWPVRGQDAGLIRKKIPSSGEAVPVIGLGTARRYEDAGTAEEAARRRQTLERFAALGASVVDTAPVYGEAEQVVGALIAESKLRERLFLATKVSTGGGRAAGLEQIEGSFRRLRAVNARPRGGA